MKRSFYFILPAVFAFNVSNVNALEIDEKLTLRFLKVSSTGKTVLINRGGEDGLVVGDHAKFFITAGVVARGVVEKVSPSRSVWSLYRVVDPNEIVQDKVLNLKIASPVKITDDPSKSLKEEAIPGGTETMNVEAPATDGSDEVVLNDSDKDELKELGIEEEASVKPAKTTKNNGKKARQTSVMDTSEAAPSSSTARTWEVFGTLAVNSLTGEVTSDQATTTEGATSASASTVDFSAGVEKYFIQSSSFIKEFSLAGFIHKKTVESGDTIKSKTDWFEYGVGVNYHFYNSAASFNKLVGFGALTLGKGSATIESKTTTNGVGDESSIEGDNTFYSFGVGAKYVLNNGFGVRAVVDYYNSTETYTFDTGSTERTLSGPRVQFGLSYRF